MAFSTSALGYFSGMSIHTLNDLATSQANSAGEIDFSVGAK